ncbi:YraN family protein [Rhizobium sp. CC-YZS058]|uniref:YraN family protein n=1 Tax=Rhizobium sp. CC-YZS058 TaxID=3042153 RepID=UPI003A4C766C
MMQPAHRLRPTRRGPDGPDRRRLRALRRGAWGEYRAALALLLTGHRLLALRYRTPVGEIDLIARKGDLILIVEVKARSSLRSAVDAVPPAAQARIRAASLLWLQRRADAGRLSLRYDIVAVLPWRWPIHVKDAF